MRRQEQSVRGALSTRKPTWWLLYSAATLWLLAFGFVEILVEGGAARKALEIAAVIAGFCLVQVWLRHNRIALDLDHERRRT